MTGKTPRCFVAMAFGRRDTDAFFDKLIQPLLQANGVVPVIINRRQSNDDLNAQIISQIELADFAVCDLTYARPSVYFEAGFAQRVAPVIYTVRSDHLKNGQPDDLRVHFDLQMKPLVTWRSPADSQFKKLFERRLRATVLRDWNRTQASDAELATARLEFQHRSLARRLIDTRAAAIAHLRKLGFKGWEPSKLKQPFTVADVRAGQHNFARSEKLGPDGTVIATVSSFETLSKGLLEGLTTIVAFPRNVAGTHGRRSVDIHHFIFVVRSTPIARVESAFRNFARDPRSGSHYVEEREAGSRSKSWWHIVAPVMSEPDVASRINELLKPCVSTSSETAG